MAIYKINESKKVAESLTEGTFDYDENSEKDQLLWDHISTNFADKCSEVIGVESEKIPEREWIELINLLVRIYKMTKSFEYSESLTEATGPQDYRVVTVTMDVAMPADKRLEDYGVGGGGRNDKLYSALSRALESVGLEMAGDYIDSVGEVTKVYKDNEYEFSFND